MLTQCGIVNKLEDADDKPSMCPICQQSAGLMCRKLLEFVRGGASLAHALAHSGVSAQVCKAQQEDAGRFLQDVHALLRALAVEDLAVQVHLTTCALPPDLASGLRVS